MVVDGGCIKRRKDAAMEGKTTLLVLMLSKRRKLFRSHERNLSSSLLGTSIRVSNKTARTEAVSKRSTSNGMTYLASSSVLRSALRLRWCAC
ncbi:hypothetical protein SADUNF_Sadunf12G0070400 [Salix dunnii]|uniref:Uncharacterized protein n=1 Tax=Salix dunnii TaxID=1413687 RepID=A0A835JI58_9ROSI|nr:hypothetical protein SADUNF_Sadunf12G0070400 [Salix dunnii]